MEAAKSGSMALRHLVAHYADCLMARIFSQLPAIPRTGKIERYTGTSGKLDVDVGVTGKSHLSWIVVNTVPTKVGEGSLAGTYVGASAGASLGIGLCANALVGGNAKNFGLQPLSAEAAPV